MIPVLASLVAIGGGVALLTPAAAERSTSTVEAYAKRCPGGLYQVRTVGQRRSSTLVAIDPGTGHERRSTELDHAVNAMGYDAAQGLFVAVSTAHKGHPIGDGGHVVAFTPTGESWDYGPLRDQFRVAGAYVGTIVDGRLLLLLDGDLVAVDVRPQSPTFMKVVRTVGLPPLPSFGDWDAHPGDGGLYAVTTHGAGPGRLVRVDPSTGAVRERPVPGLPGEGFYGAVAFDESGAHLYALDNNQDGAVYRIDLDGTATRLATGPGQHGADAAWCPRPSPPRQTTPPAAPPRKTPPPATAPTTVPPRSQPAVLPPPVPARPVPPSRPAAPATTAPSPTPPPSPTPAAAVRSMRKRMVVAEPPKDDRTTTVRWGIVLLVLGLGGMAFAKPIVKPFLKARPR